MVKIKDYIRGDSRLLQIPITNADGTPFDLSGCEVFFTVNAAEDPETDSGAVIEKSTTSFDNPELGIAEIQLLAGDTEIPVGDYFYDVQLKDTSGNISSVKRDTFNVIADVTRRTT